MFSIRRHMSYANVAATFALVFAMSGGALAASHYLITSTKQIKPSVLASLKGKAGANGAPGAQGPAGANGTGIAGPAGPTGGTGKEGPEGKEGHEGKQGEPGKNGETGFTETLPSGKTETGTWSDELGAVEREAAVSISFPIPLAHALASKFSVHFVNTEDKEFAHHEFVLSTVCLGSAGKPEAKPGNLCVYENLLETNAPREELEVEFLALGADSSREAGAGTTGAIMLIPQVPAGTGVGGFGAWAVTAESE